MPGFMDLFLGDVFSLLGERCCMVLTLFPPTCQTWLFFVSLVVARVGDKPPTLEAVDTPSEYHVKHSRVYGKYPRDEKRTTPKKAEVRTSRHIFCMIRVDIVNLSTGYFTQHFKFTMHISTQIIATSDHLTPKGS